MESERKQRKRLSMESGWSQNGIKIIDPNTDPWDVPIPTQPGTQTDTPECDSNMTYHMVTVHQVCSV